MRSCHELRDRCTKPLLFSVSGVRARVIRERLELKTILQARKQLVDLSRSDQKSFRYIEGKRPWKCVGSVDVALPCATQNEVCRDFCSIASLSRYSFESCTTRRGFILSRCPMKIIDAYTRLYRSQEMKQNL